MYSNLDIVTIDDDVFYDRRLLELLIKEKRKRPNTIIGTRGREIRTKAGELAPYSEWKKAGSHTDSRRLLLTGVGGILYPAGVSLDPRLFEEELFTKICPLADDVWFWAAAKAKGADTYCLDIKCFRPVRSLSPGPELWIVNAKGGENDRQLRLVLEEFGLRVSDLQ
jgi:hypothetical protein